jgi:serine/threonine-protein kinase
VPKADDHTGRLVAGRYLLERAIGEGGFGRVYLATDQRLETSVAVKVIHPWWAGDGEWIQRFAEEAKTGARITHPGVVRVTDTGSDAEIGPFLVSDRVDGESLRSLLDREGTLPPGRAAALVAEAADALAAAHEQGVVHRDVKPANLLLGRDGRLRVCDFGIARLQTGATRSSASHTLVGTPAYMAPEQALGKAAGPAADQYALGTVLFETLTGRPPFEGDTPVATALAQMSADAPEIPARVPAHLRAPLRRALAKDPADRFPDCRALAHALRTDSTAPTQPAVGASTRRGARRRAAPQHDPSAATTPLRRPRPRRRVAVGLVAATVLVLAGVAAAVLATGGSTPQAPAGAAAAADPTGTAASERPAGEPAVVRVPRVVGLPVARAQARIERRGLGFVAVRHKSVRQPQGRVVSQRPKAASTLEEGGNVVLTVSAGPPPVALPDVENQSTEQASKTLTSAGLTVKATSAVVSARPAGTVIRTEPPAGTELPPGTAVTLVVARAKTWQKVGSYSFTSDGQTPRFRIRADEWRITYTLEPSCRRESWCMDEADLVLMPGLEYLDLSKGTHSTAIAAKPGRYYFEFDSLEPATLELTVEEFS